MNPKFEPVVVVICSLVIGFIAVAAFALIVLIWG